MQVSTYLDGDGSIGGPADEPQGHVGDGGLGNAEFSTLGLSLLQEERKKPVKVLVIS